MEILGKIEAEAGKIVVSRKAPPSKECETWSRPSKSSILQTVHVGPKAARVKCRSKPR